MSCSYFMLDILPLLQLLLFYCCIFLILLSSCYLSLGAAVVQVINNTSCCPLALLLHVTCLLSCHLSWELEYSSACEIANLIDCPSLTYRRKQCAGWLLHFVLDWYINRLINWYIPKKSLIKSLYMVLEPGLLFSRRGKHPWELVSSLLVGRFLSIIRDF